ncbi:hypothetical protein ACFX2A_011743 [Malus domestica]
MLAFRFAVLRSARLMEYFLDHAKDNTEKGLETCRILGAFLISGQFLLSPNLVYPYVHIQNVINDQEALAIQNEQSPFPVGWILVESQTHLSQSCFISSVDCHTHSSYQVMIPEAFAIVTTPTDTSRYAATLNTKFSRYALNKIWQFHRRSVRFKSLKCSISFHLYFGSQALDAFFHSLGVVLAFVLAASSIFDNNGSTLGCGH